MAVQVDKTTSESRLPDFAAIRHRPAIYAASPEIRSLYADECQSCGMCCIYYGGKFSVPVHPHGQQPPKRFIQIGKRMPNWTRGSKPQEPGVYGSAYLRSKPDEVWKGFNRCAALVGIQGVKVRCSIYSQRPYACSDYDPGSPECLKIRKWAGLEPIDDGYGHS